MAVPDQLPNREIRYLQNLFKGVHGDVLRDAFLPLGLRFRTIEFKVLICNLKTEISHLVGKPSHAVIDRSGKKGSPEPDAKFVAFPHLLFPRFGIRAPGLEKDFGRFFRHQGTGKTH